MAIRVSNFHKTFIVVDGESVNLKIKRLTVDENTAFQRNFNTYNKLKRGSELALQRGPDEEALSAAEIDAKRFFLATDEERARLLEREAKDSAEGNAFVISAIAEYVTAEPGQIVDEDSGQDVTAGADLVRFFGARNDVLIDMLVSIHLENTLSEQKKRMLRLQRASLITSPEAETATGEKPAPTAESAESAASAPHAAATVLSEPIPSGSTDRSN